MGSRQDLLLVAAFTTCIKILLVPAYHSTDLEVHRHWLAITHSLPLKDWYKDETSEWSLDYPPFFAWFQKFLSFFAHLVDARMVHLSEGLNYASDRVVLFQRITVMAADVVLYYGLWKCTRFLGRKQRLLVYFAVVLSPGLLMVDHIHFQYNGFFLGILLTSVGFLEEGHDVAGGIAFAVLVCFKHLFAVAGPVYLVYLFRHYCHSFSKFCTLGASVLAVVAAAFAPFAYYGQIGQVLRRLFPFGRGLCHAYWAPNFWALYNTADKVLALALGRLGFKVDRVIAGMTGGLVGDFSPYAVLPQVTPAMTMILVLLTMLPCLVRIWKNPSHTQVVRWITYSFTCGFMFGWHVHEKASLHIVIPFSLMAVHSTRDAGSFIFTSTVSYYSLFPLIFEAKEYPIKVVILVVHTWVMWLGFASYFEASSNEALEKEKTAEGKFVLLVGECKRTYLLGLIAVELYSGLLHHILFGDRLPFFPLMLISVYCSLGLLYSWTEQLRALQSTTVI